jgi:hypothetical protein
MISLRLVLSFNICCAGVNDKGLFLKTNHHYHHQIQGQLHITGLDVCDLVVWTTKDLQIVRLRKDVDWSPNLSKMIDFYLSVFLPDILRVR